MDDLALIAEIRTALSNLNMQAAWSGVQSLESTLERDPNYSHHEKQLIRQLRSQVSDVIAAKRNGLNPHTGSASATLTAVESSIRRRTTGADGWKLG